MSNGSRRRKVFVSTDVEVEKRDNNGASSPAKWTVTLLKSPELDYFKLNRVELFAVADALAKVCNDIEDAEDAQKRAMERTRAELTSEWLNLNRGKKND